MDVFFHAAIPLPESKFRSCIRCLIPLYIVVCFATLALCNTWPPHLFCIHPHPASYYIRLIHQSPCIPPLQFIQVYQCDSNIYEQYIYQYLMSLFGNGMCCELLVPPIGYYPSTKINIYERLCIVWETYKTHPEHVIRDIAK